MIDVFALRLLPLALRARPSLDLSSAKSKLNEWLSSPLPYVGVANKKTCETKQVQNGPSVELYSHPLESDPIRLPPPPRVQGSKPV